MKIVGVDNFARENVSEILVAENVNEFYAQLIVDKLNDNENNYYFYTNVSDDYVLYVYDPT